MGYRYFIYLFSIIFCPIQSVNYAALEFNLAFEPIWFRQPKQSFPFGPGRLDRKWTGTAASIQVEEIKCGENKAGEELDSWEAIDSRGGKLLL